MLSFDFDTGFLKSIALLGAEQQLQATTDPQERADLERKIQTLNHEITPAARQAAVEVHRFVIEEARKWLAKHRSMNVQRFTKHLNGAAVRKYNHASTFLKEGAMRAILRNWGYVGKRGRPRKSQ